MKIFNTISIVTALVVSSTLVVFGPVGSTPVFAATSPILVESASYSVLAGSIVTNIGPTTVSGDLGVSPSIGVPPHVTGFLPGIVNAPSAIHDADAPAAAAQADNTVAFGILDQTCDLGRSYVGVKDLTTISPLNPGVYCADAFILTGNLNLTGSGVWIFKSASTIITSPGASVTGGDPCNIWWRAVSSVTLDLNTIFKGNILASTAITLNDHATLDGRAMTQTAQVSLTNNIISGPVCTAPATLHVIKAVTNDNGGTAIAASAVVHIKNGLGDVVGSPQAGAGAPGASYTLAAGAYTVSEDAFPGYSATITGDCALNGNINLISSQEKTCTITNDDIAPTINVVKIVINDNGRTKVVADFPLFVNGAPVVSGATNTFAVGAYAVTETADSDYAATFSGDCDAGGNLNLLLGDSKFCVITNNDIAPPSGGGGGGGSYYVPPVPPLIDVVKVPSPLALPGGPGPVIYTYTLRNIGTVPVTNITVVDDSCSPAALISGDTNLDAKLDVSEIWTYRCSATLSKTHTNTVVATGWANYLSTTDLASATVVVGSAVAPPLIHVTKTPIPFTLPFDGGMVTYVEKITNPGTVALTNIHLTDDTCSPMRYISGDTNRDAELDITETWLYTCRVNLTETTTNTAVASGEGNGFTVRDFAIATVPVATIVPKLPVATTVPKLPNAGFGPEEDGLSWDIIAFSSVLIVVSISLVAIINKLPTRS